MTVDAKGRSEAIRLFKKNGMESLTRQEMKFAFDYLLFFGYIGVELVKNVSYEDLMHSVKSFQHMFGLKQDGISGNKSVRAMECPRCGCPDHIDQSNKQHIQFLRAQEITAGHKDRWNKQGLKYFIAGYVGGTVSRNIQKQVVAAAFKSWDDICGLNVTEVKTESKADIIISSGRGIKNNFDGRGGTLAWAYLPTGNDNQQLTMKFDLDETWVTGPKQRGIQMLNVACHEFGHLLGLTHSKKPGALMAPYYNPFIATPQQDDDIVRVQKLYGPNQKSAMMRKPRKNLSVELHAGQRMTIICK